jgi:alpha-amylase
LEAYHAGLKNLGSKDFEGAASIHEQARVKEEGLERWLHYDRWPRHAFRLLLFSPTKTYQDCATVSLEENAALAGGRFRVVEVSKTGATLASEESADWPAKKTFRLMRTPKGFEISCDVTVQRTAPGAASVVVGIEAVVNFLAPSAPDRYFESSGQRYPLRWASAVPASSLLVVDEWQKTEVELRAHAARDFWISPIETVSESEDGFERIYQGSQIIAIWPIELQAGAKWHGNLTLAISRVD